MAALLSVKNLNIYFETYSGKMHVVRDLNFELAAGETMGIVGESGCGKSVSQMSLMGLLPENAQVSGTMSYQEKCYDLGDFESVAELRGKKMAMIFQDPMTSLNPAYTVYFQMKEALQRAGIKKDFRERSIELLEDVGIPAPEQRLHSYPHQLSGGMSQRVMIAMAIAMRPHILIADEPTTALDVTIQGQILNLLKSLQQKYGMALILITHDIAVVEYMSRKMMVMYAGEEVESGETEKLISQPRHPYTKSLLASLPSRHGKVKEPLATIPGVVPNLLLRPEGCQFAERCSEMIPSCREVAIELKDGVRCLLTQGDL